MASVVTDTFLSLILLRTFLYNKKQPVSILYPDEVKLYIKLINSFPEFHPASTYDSYEEIYERRSITACQGKINYESFETEHELHQRIMYFISENITDRIIFKGDPYLFDRKMYKVFKSSDNIKTYRNLIQSTNYNPYCLFSKNTIRDNKNKIILLYMFTRIFYFFQ